MKCLNVFMKHMIQKYIEDDNYQLLQEYILLPTDQNFGRIFRYFSETSGPVRFETVLLVSVVSI